MIKINEIAQEIALFVNSDDIKKVVCHRNNKSLYATYIRLNFVLDIFIVSLDTNKYGEDYFQEKFKEFLKGKGQYVPNGFFKVNFHIFPESDADDLYVKTVIGEGSSINNGPRYRLNSILDSENKLLVNNRRRRFPIVTFYSYKGGMGRTTTMISYAIHLAQQHKKVVVIDCDLEAPGYLNFFNLSKHDSLISGKKNGLVEFFSDLQFYNDINAIQLDDYIINVGFNNNINYGNWGQNIYIVPAGNLNETSEDGANAKHRNAFLEGLSRINLTDINVIRDSFNVLFNKIGEDIAPDVILLDSRTGYNDIIGTTSIFFSNAVVSFFGNSEQTLPGLLSLLDLYKESKFTLYMVNSILPNTKDAESLFESFTTTIQNYITNYAHDDSNMPHFEALHRDATLELIGTPKQKDERYYNLIKSDANPDYCSLFASLDETLNLGEKSIKSINYSFHTESDKDDKTNKDNKDKRATVWQLRNSILQDLKYSLMDIKPFAENENISEEQFFYRDCMNELFEENKFIIRGYKGTGKTYLYKSLADDRQSHIAKKILSRANKRRIELKQDPLDENAQLIFIDIISLDSSGDKSYDFDIIEYDSIPNPTAYFKKFWQIHTWLSILLDDRFSNIRDESPLKEYILPIKGDARTQRRFNDLINGGIDILVHISDDLDKVNRYLSETNSRLFIMYDQLDSKVQPRYWEKAVSPLINHWRQNVNTYSNILPKIFVRTDLYNRVVGTNSAYLSNNIINIEWHIGEIFAYFIKVVMSKKESADKFWELMEITRPGPYKLNIESEKKEIQENENQLARLDRFSLSPYLRVLFGYLVVVNGQYLGAPYDYFKTTLSNADRISNSLRPFITTFDNNAVDAALLETTKKGFVTSIINSNIYASREVRIKAATTYFEDLTRDAFSKDLSYVKKYLDSDSGSNYRYKSLTEEQFNKFIKGVFSSAQVRHYAQGEDDIRDMLFANGIIAEKVIRGGKIYRFAPMYFYAWALRNTKFEKNERYIDEDDE